MNLSPLWVEAFAEYSIEAVHWSSIGDPRAKDYVIMSWARQNDHVIFTHDLDFGALLALTKTSGPSVIQVRTQNIHPSHLAPTVAAQIKTNEEALKTGALIVIDERRARVRILPL